LSSNENFDWTTSDWIKKLKQQAEDSSEYRHKLYKKVNLKNKKKILDVGCGTGAVTLDIAGLTNGEVTGIDIDSEKLKEAERVLSNVPNIKLIEADVLDLPFEDDTFDLVVFTIVLIHVKDQQKAISQMVRVTKTGGFVLACLEPDYSGIIGYPDNPAQALVLKSLETIGADLSTGRKLKFYFNRAGLKTEVGIDTDSEFIFPTDDQKRLKHFEQEFWILEKSFKQHGWTDEKIHKYKSKQADLIKSGLSFRFSPCFYAIGKKV
jgi:ubiquinone/menaquinone biosynthesis C-methylase UbiE